MIQQIKEYETLIQKFLYTRMEENRHPKLSISIFNKDRNHLDREDMLQKVIHINIFWTNLNLSPYLFETRIFHNIRENIIL